MQWIQKDGNSIEVSEMTDFHIQNCIRLLEIRLKELPDPEVYIGDGENGGDWVEQENRQIFHFQDEIKEWLNIFRQELTNRNNI